MSEEFLSEKVFSIEEVRPVSRGWILFGFLFYWLSIIGCLLGAVLLAVFMWKSVPSEIRQSAEARFSQNLNPPIDDSGNAGTNIVAARNKNERSEVGEATGSQLVQKKEGESLHTNFRGFPVVGMMFFVYGMLFAVFFCGLPMLIISFATLHRAWRSIQCLRVVAPRQALGMDTPSTAVGLLFCPYFNIYWMFPALLRVEKYGRILAAKRGVEYRGPSSSAIISYLVLNFCMIVPVLGWLLCFFVSPFLWYSLVKKFNAMIEDLGKPGSITLSE